MKILTTTLGFAVLAFAVANPALAQSTTTTPPPNQCEVNQHFSDFDFWVGDWKVYSNDDARTFAGTNSITKHYGNCLIKESWQGASDSAGFSINYFDPLDDQWRQVWVSRNLSIDYTGGLNDEGAMVLEGTIHYYGNGTSFPFRGIWSAQEDGSVVQHFDQYDPETETWNVWFEGLYIKQEADPNPPASN